MGVTRTIWTSIAEPAPRLRAPLPGTARQAAAFAQSGARADAMMTIREVADACRLSETAVRRAIYEGELQAVKLRSRLRIRPGEFDTWIASQRTPAKPRLAVAAAARERRPRAPRTAPPGTFRARIQADKRSRSL
jgi:excisionase family DNA binding protein